MLSSQRLQRLPRGGRARLLLGRGRRALLLAVGRLAVDRDPRARSRRHPDRARPPAGSGRLPPAPPCSATRRASSPAWGRRGRAGGICPAAEGGRLRIASFPTAGATLMPEAIADFRASHPGVELSLAEGEPEEIAPRLRSGEFDLALLFEFEGVGERLGAGMRRFELLDDPLHLALPAEQPLAHARAAAAARGPARGVLGADLGGGPCARHVVRSCHAAGFEPRSPSRATTTRPCRAWSRPGSGSA